MRVIGIDPGIRNCGFVIVEGRRPIHFGLWHDYEGEDELRAACLARGIALACQMWNVEAIVTERFFGNAGKTAHARSKANYQRGMVDMAFSLALGHLPQARVMPVHLKQFAAIAGNAKKELMIAALETRIAQLFPAEAAHLYASFTAQSQREHVLEAWGLACIGSLTRGTPRFTTMGNELLARETELLKKIDKTIWIPARRDRPIMITE